jgi:TRAP-type uncharacterized transport system substrate-binding protein
VKQLRNPGRATLALAILFLAATAAGAPPSARIASGPAGGSYRGVYARALERGLDGYLVIHRTTSGSGQNLDLISEGKVAVAFVQADVYADRVAADPERFADVSVLGRLADECFYVAARLGGRVASIDALAVPAPERPYDVALGPPDSGTAGSWRYLTRLRPDLASATTHDVTGRHSVQMLSDGFFDVVMWVTDPANLEHPMLSDVRANEKLKLLEVGESVRGAQLPDGTRVYDVRSIAVEPGAGARQVRTLCTSALVLARDDTPPDLVARVRKIFRLAPPLAP